MHLAIETIESPEWMFLVEAVISGLEFFQCDFAIKELFEEG